jgi:hypothetical protein
VRTVGTLILGVALMTAAGCTSLTVKELKDKPAASDSVIVPVNYQKLYRDLLGKMQECFQEGTAGVFSRMDLDHALYSDLGEAQITYLMTSAGIKNYLLHVDIAAKGQHAARLDTFVSLYTWKPLMEQVQRWAVDPLASCTLPTLESPQTGPRR